MIKYYNAKQTAKLQGIAIRILQFWGYTEKKIVSLNDLYNILKSNNLLKQSYLKQQPFSKKNVVMVFAKEVKNSKEYRELKPVKRKDKNKSVKKINDKRFYSSWAWKKLRLKIIKKYGPKCMCCNSIERIVVDHIKPRSKFPELELDESNMQVLCNDCNMGKSNDDFTDFRPS